MFHGPWKWVTVIVHKTAAKGDNPEMQSERFVRNFHRNWDLNIFQELWWKATTHTSRTNIFHISQESAKSAKQNFPPGTLKTSKTSVFPRDVHQVTFQTSKKKFHKNFTKSDDSDLQTNSFHETRTITSDFDLANPLWLSEVFLSCSDCPTSCHYQKTCQMSCDLIHLCNVSKSNLCKSTCISSKSKLSCASELAWGKTRKHTTASIHAQTCVSSKGKLRKLTCGSSYSKLTCASVNCCKLTCAS